MWLSEAQVRGFYYGFANSALWPLCHLTLERTVFKPRHWRHYQDVNAHFAESVAEECAGTAGHCVGAGLPPGALPGDAAPAPA